MNHDQLYRIIEAAKAGGKISRDYFGSNLLIEEKGMASDIRTKADTESETAIINILKNYFPTYGILSEESGYLDNNNDDEQRFVIDPLDGSNNFVMGIPNFSVSIAVMTKDEIMAAVIYVPMVDQTFTAIKGEGAYANGKPIHVNGTLAADKSTISYTCGYINDSDYTLAITKQLSELNVKRQINFWSPAYDYCLLASGKIEAVINNGNEIYDFAAGKLLVKEAGGTITDFNGNRDEDVNPQFLASNGTVLHKSLLRILS